jgi:ferredoxin
VTESAYENLCMFCFSGTGNALLGGRWIADEGQKAGADSTLTRIDRLSKPELPAGKTLLGLLFATHGFCTPWLMLKFMVRFPSRAGRDIDVFLLNTRAGMKLGPVYLPGVSGLAVLLPVLLLLLKGYRIVGTRPLDLPSNWMQLHPSLSHKAVDAIVAHRQTQVRSFAQRLLSGRSAWHGWWTLPLDLSLAPIAAVYLPVGRLCLAKLQVANYTCDGCGLCEKLCPANAIRMKRGRPYWTFDCESCMRCLSVCPKQAVECSHSFAILGGVGMWLLAAPIERVANLTGNIVASYAIQYAALLLFVYLSYLLMSLLLRVRFINILFTYTSATRYFRRYLAPGIKAAAFRMKGEPPAHRDS